MLDADGDADGDAVIELPVNMEDPGDDEDATSVVDDVPSDTDVFKLLSSFVEVVLMSPLFEMVPDDELAEGGMTLDVVALVGSIVDVLGLLNPVVVLRLLNSINEVVPFIDKVKGELDIGAEVSTDEGPMLEVSGDVVLPRIVELG